MSSINETEVFVAGAGPVGLFTALALAERGIRVRIADKYQRSALHSYALALHPQTLRLLHEHELADRLIEHGQRVERLEFCRGGETLAEIDVSAVGGEFPFALVVPQSVLESALEDRLESNGVRVEWSHPVLTFDAFTDGVAVLLGSMPSGGEDPDECSEVSTEQVLSSFLVGTDGYDSLTRRLLGLSFDRVGPQTTFGLLEFATELQHPDRIRIVFGEDTTDVLWPLGPDRGRWSAQIRDGEPHDVPAVREIIGRRAPWFESGIGEVHWSTSVTFDQRLAERFGRGTVWMAGESAHMTTPVGVQNMNVGMREGHDLGRRMAEILRENGSQDLLKYYNDERRKEWRRLLGMKPAEARPEAAERARFGIERLVASMPASGKDLNVLLRQIGLEIPGPHRR